MTRANANQWFTDAGAANSIMPIVRFVTPDRVREQNTRLWLAI